MLRMLILAATMLVTARPAFAQLTMGPEAIGPIKRGWTISDVLASGMPYEREVVPTEGDPNIVYTLKVDDQTSVALLFSSDDMPFGLSTDSSVFVTTEGARVGDTLAVLQRIYPKGRVFITAEEGLQFAFLPQGAYVAGRPSSAFEFDPSGLSDDCILDHGKCPDLSGRRSLSFATSW